MRDIENALASGPIEGLEPSAEALAIFQRYIDGELTLEQMGAAIDEHADGNMDPYVYPGTNVLKNPRDIRDPERLSKFEMDMTTRRLSELARNPTAGKFNAQHLQSIHGYIFQDVYEWAGEFRTVNISRSGQFPFAFPEHITVEGKRRSSLNAGRTLITSKIHLCSPEEQHSYDAHMYAFTN